MSTVVVVRKNNVACIAADTLTSFGSTKQLGHYKSEPDKILRVGESYVATVGTPVHRLVLSSVLSRSTETPLLSTRQDIFEFFRGLHPRLKDEYYVNPKEGDKDPYESSQMDLLIANRHGLFGVFSFREVYEYSRFWALGSGMDYALGAMFAVYDHQQDAQEIAQIGLKAALEFDDATAPPVTAYTVKLTGGRGIVGEAE